MGSRLGGFHRRLDFGDARRRNPKPTGHPPQRFIRGAQQDIDRRLIRLPMRACEDVGRRDAIDRGDMLKDGPRGQPSGRRLGRGDIGHRLPSHQPLDPLEERRPAEIDLPGDMAPWWT